MDFAPLKTRSLLISLKRDTFDHPPLFMNNEPYPQLRHNEKMAVARVGLCIVYREPMEGLAFRYD